MTNNSAELEALARALQLLLRRPTPTTAVIHTDSDYARRAILGTNKPKKNANLIQFNRRLLHKAKQVYDTISIQHVAAHCGIKGNELADQQAKLGAKKCVQ